MIDPSEAFALTTAEVFSDMSGALGLVMCDRRSVEYFGADHTVTPLDAIRIRLCTG